MDRFDWVSWHDTYEKWLYTFDLPRSDVTLIFNSSIVVLMIVSSVIFFHIGTKLIYYLLGLISQREKANVLRALTNNKFFTLLGYYAPLLVVHYCLSLMLSHAGSFVPIMGKIYQVLHILLFTLITNSLLNTFVDINQYGNRNHPKPVKGLVQFIQIIIFFLMGIVVISIVFGVNPTKSFSYLGAASAIVILIFKDSILGVVAGVQLSFNKMIEIGDWISMTKYDIDGKVIDITITTVKVKNWDETISTIPTYSMISTDSIRNWKGMVQGDSRRMLRSIFIDLFSVKFCTQEMLDKYKGIDGIDQVLRYLSDSYGDPVQGGIESLAGSHITNIGIFRAYAYHLLRQNKNINQQMDLMIREQQPTNFGLPIQIYCFTNTSKWEKYENIQSDILDHLIAILPRFDLSVFQSPKDNRAMELLESDEKK